MKQELVNLHASLCAIWVDHDLLEPEIPRNSFALIAPTNSFNSDGIYALHNNENIKLSRCACHTQIIVADNYPQSIRLFEEQEFSKIVMGKVVAHAKCWL